ncbi:hypothetical protein B0H14DRAFT_2548090 [Mycena olivaceomarginata]|nr:hypothetical protein B0H14DRAFT_2548090 [Mycena olivaceomarginata]
MQATTTTGVSGVQRRPRKCRQCTGSPYLSHCIHSVAGRQRLNSSVVQTGNTTPTSGSSSNTGALNPPASGSDLTLVGLNNMAQMEFILDPTQLPPLSHLPQIYQSLLPGSYQGSPFNAPLSQPNWGTPAHQPNVNATLSPEGAQTPVNSEDPFNSDLQNTASSPATTPTPRSRIRPSKANPTFGKVKGAYRGSEPAGIVRTRPKKEALTDRKACSQRFSRKTKELIERCEDLAQETGCWLFFTAQHTHAKEPFYHYTSPRLLRDSKSDVETVTNTFNKLFASLLAARQKDASLMHKQLEEVQAAQASSSRALEEALNERELAQNKLEDANKRLEEYKALLAAHTSN